MDQNFSLMAQSRANYYTAGSPVQFVRVELLKGDATGEVAVCLSFKNVGTELLTGMVIHFKCKDAAGQVLCEDDFYYENLEAHPGDLFGTDDAVFVSDTPVSSVEIEQDRAFLNGKGVDLRAYKRVRLQTPRVLPASIAKNLQVRTGNAALICVPQDTENGWFCACGAFHPNEEAATVCSECGGDRAYIKASLTSILEEARQAAVQQEQEINAVSGGATPPAVAPPAQPAPVDEPTAQYQPQEAPAEPAAQEYDDEEEETDANMKRISHFAPKGRLFADADEDDEETDNTRMYDTDETGSYDIDDEEEAPVNKKRGRYADDDEETDDDVLAEHIIHWAPPITAVICALIIALTLIYYFVIA